MQEALSDEPDPASSPGEGPPGPGAPFTVWIFGDLPLGTACGPSYMVESWARELGRLGAVTRLFTPSGTWRRRTTSSAVAFRTVRHVGFAGDHHARFSSLVQLWRARKAPPDVVLVATPGRVGVLGATLSAGCGVPLVLVESTDVTGAMAHFGAARMLASSGSKPLVLFLAASRMRTAMRTWPRRAGRQLLRGPTLAALYAEAMRGLARDVVWLSSKSLTSSSPCPDVASAVVIPAGIDRLPETAAPPALHWRPGALRVLYVGRLSPEKSLPMLVESVAIAARAGVDVQLVLVGGGPLAGGLRAQASRAGVADRVSVIGPYERRRLGGVFAGADVFAFPSVVETQAFVLNEAAHEGLPLLVSDPDVNPVVRAGTSALVVPHDPTAYADALQRLQDPELRARLGSCAAELARTLTERDQTARLAAVLRGALTPAGARTASVPLARSVLHLAADAPDAAPAPVDAGLRVGSPGSGTR